MKLILDPEVHSDVLEIMQYYDQVADAGISADFYFEFRRCIDKIAARPYSFPFYIDDYRRLNLDRFPHHILYRIVSDEFVRGLSLDTTAVIRPLDSIDNPVASDKPVRPAYNRSFIVH